MSAMIAEPTVVWGETLRIGHGDAYQGGRGILATYVTIEGETFVQVNGLIYTLCGYCGDPVPGVKAYYGHVHNGVCFQCRGRGIRREVGTIEGAVKVAKRRIADRERAARKRAEADAAAEQVRAEWAEKHADLAARLAQIAEDSYWGPGEPDSGYYAAEETRKVYGEFVIELAQRAAHAGLTPKQTVAVAAAIERADLEAAEREAKRVESRWLGAKGDKVTVKGVVTVRTEVPDNYSRTGGYKPLVVVECFGEHAGVTVKMIGTAAILYEMGRGDEVEVTGTVKDHGEYDGVKQTILIRPKGKVLAEAPSEEA